MACFPGGLSSEREISLQSGITVREALEAVGHRVSTIDPARVDCTIFDWSELDVAFIALHGPFGEDGQIQMILEQAGIPYTGSGPVASQLAFSKSACKERFFDRGIPTPEYSLIHESDSVLRIESIAERIGFPLVAKPDGQGSSIGVRIVESSGQLSQATSSCFEFGPFAILERAVPSGCEWTLGLLDSRPLPLLKVIPATPFFDFSAKYNDERTSYSFSFDEPRDAIDRIVQAGVQANQSVGAEGITRVDILTDADGNPWVLEVNTIPGFTDHSLVPKASEYAGTSLPQLFDTEIRAAMARKRPRNNSIHRCERHAARPRRRAG